MFLGASYVELNQDFCQSNRKVTSTFGVTKCANNLLKALTLIQTHSLLSLYIQVYNKGEARK